MDGPLAVRHSIVYAMLKLLVMYRKHQEVTDHIKTHHGNELLLRSMRHVCGHGHEITVGID